MIAKNESNGTGFLVVAVPILLLGLFVLWTSIGASLCESENVKECLSDDRRPQVLYTGIVCSLIIFASSVLAFIVKYRPEWRSTLTGMIVASCLLSILAFAYWFIIFAAAGIASTT